MLTLMLFQTLLVIKNTSEFLWAYSEVQINESLFLIYSWTFLNLFKKKIWMNCTNQTDSVPESMNIWIILVCFSDKAIDPFHIFGVLRCGSRQLGKLIRLLFIFLLFCIPICSNSKR